MADKPKQTTPKVRSPRSDVQPKRTVYPDSEPTQARPDEDRVAIPLDPVEALRALLKVDPEDARVSSRPEGQRKETPKQEDERG